MNNWLERKIRQLESFPKSRFCQLVFYTEDNISDDPAIYKISFMCGKNYQAAIGFDIDLAEECQMEIFLNGVKISGYKPVIGKNTIKLQTGLIKNSINCLKINFNKSVVYDLTAIILGDISDLKDENKISHIKGEDFDLICFYQKALSKMTLYRYKEGVLQEIYSEQNLNGASLSKIDGETAGIFIIDNSNHLCLKYFNLNLLQVSLVLHIDSLVTCVSGAYSADGFCARYIKDNTLLKVNAVSDGVYISDTGIKSPQEVICSPDSEDFIVIGYDKQASLYRMIPQNQ